MKLLEFDWTEHAPDAEHHDREWFSAEHNGIKYEVIGNDGRWRIEADGIVVEETETSGMAKAMAHAFAHSG